MNRRRLNIYLSAIRRYKRSKGFGVHSPFAFTFILRVLRERLEYYAYEGIDCRRRQAASLAARVEGRRPKLISRRSAKMLFRIACYFRPAVMLEIGTTYGVSAATLLDVDSSSCIIIYKGKSVHRQVYDEVLSSYSRRITGVASVCDAFALYREECRKRVTMPFVLVNSIDTEEEIATCVEGLMESICSGGIVVLRNLMNSDLMVRILADTERGLTHGMTFTNSRMAVIVGLSHLPRQRYSLWF